MNPEFVRRRDRSVLDSTTQRKLPHERIEAVVTAAVGQEAEVMTEPVGPVNRLRVARIDPDLNAVGRVRRIGIRDRRVLLSSDSHRDAQPVRIPGRFDFDR